MAARIGVAPVIEFTYRSARSGSLVVGLGLAIAIETAVVHLVLRTSHPIVAWTLTAASVTSICWLAADYYALGRGSIRIDSDAVNVRVGRRAFVHVPLCLVDAVVRPGWRDLPATRARGSTDYRNIMKPATPNVLMSLTAPVSVRHFGAITRPARRI